MDTIMEKRASFLLISVLILGVGFVIIGILGLIHNRGVTQNVTPNTNRIISKPTRPEIDPVKLADEISTEEILTGDKVPPSLSDPDKLIEFYSKRLENNPPQEEIPALLSAIGNLYKDRKQDCASAVPYYERVLIEYPDWGGSKSIYPLLGVCYDELDDARGRIWLYQEMMRRFPPDSQEYIFAKTELGLSNVEDVVSQGDKETKQIEEQPEEGTEIQ